MAAINYQKYIDSLKYSYYFDTLKGFPELNLEQIIGFEEPYRKLLYAYYGYIAQLDNYTVEELNEIFYDDINFDLYDEYYKNVYILAVISKNLKTIKYLHSRNINYDFVLYKINNIYYMAILIKNLKLIKYYDSNNIIFTKMSNVSHFKTNSYLEAAGMYNSLKMIKYFELKAKDAPNFELQIIYCYISMAYNNQNRLFKYLESKYPLYITNDIIHITCKKAIKSDNLKAFIYLNRNNKYLNTLKIKYRFLLSFQYIDLKYVSKIFKYIYSKISELQISRIEYAEFYNERIYNRLPYKQISNYLIRYRTKYSLCYI